MKVIGTAGHIDHGKSTLVECLTGIDPDRFAEEKRRGMTIDLGFAWLKLPSGREVSIVDVPGHERFIKNMLAGSGGIDVALLVVAADEGVMPQTREHLDILDLLGVSCGVVAVTKADLADDELIALVQAEIEEALEPTGLAGSAVIPVSARTGAGIDALLTALDRAVSAESEPEGLSIPYLPIDRVFSVAGFGTVVTGTMHGGEILVGQEIEVLPNARRARIRGIQTHRRSVLAAHHRTRVALNLSPLDQDQVQRGDVVALPGTVRTVVRVGAKVTVLPHLVDGLVHGLRVAVHLGAAEVHGTVSVAGAESVPAGETGSIFLRLDRPVPAIRAERFVLRLPAPLNTIAGGRILDLRPRGRRRDPSTKARLQAMGEGDDRLALDAILSEPRAHALPDLATLLSRAQPETARLLAQAERAGSAIRLNALFVGSRFWNELERRAASTLRAHHDEHPLQTGLPREELRRKLGLGRDAGAAAVARLIESGALRAHGSEVSLPGWSGVDAVATEDARRILRVLSDHPLAPPTGGDLLAQAHTDQSMVDALARSGTIVKIAGGMYLERSAYGRIVAEIVSTIEREGEVTVAGLRDRHGTSRKYALALLEHLDDERITRRVGDRRILGSRRPPCA